MKRNKEINNERIAYLIEFQDWFQKRKFSPCSPSWLNNTKQKFFRRREMSPKFKSTYIAVSNVNLQNDRYQEQPENLKLKLIRAYVKSKKNSSKNENSTIL